MFIDNDVIEFIWDSEEWFGLKHLDVDAMDYEDIVEYVEWLNYLWAK